MTYKPRSTGGPLSHLATPSHYLQPPPLLRHIVLCHRLFHVACGEMHVPLDRPQVGMSENLCHRHHMDPALDHARGKGVAEDVDHTRDSSFPTDLIMRTLKLGDGSTGIPIGGEHPGRPAVETRGQYPRTLFTK